MRQYQQQQQQKLNSMAIVDGSITQGAVKGHEVEWSLKMKLMTKILWMEDNCKQLSSKQRL